MQDLNDVSPYLYPIYLFCAILTGFITIFTKGRKWIVYRYRSYKDKKIAKAKMPDRIEQIYEKVDNMNTRLMKVEKEITPNSGGSMNDVVKLIKSELDANNWLSPRPTFRTNSAGHNTFVNEAYCQLCGVTADELLKLGWKNFITNEIKADDYYTRWLVASKELSQFSARLKFENKYGEDRGEWTIRIRPLGAISSEGESDYLWHGCLFPFDEVAKGYASRYNIPLLA